MKIFGFLKYILPAAVLMLSSMSAYAQVDKKDVRRGNRDFRKENYREAEIDYRKALVKDSLSLAANYNLASTLYRQGDMEQAGKVLDNVKEVAPVSAAAADYWYNRGDVALEMKDYQAAVEAFAESLKINPGDLDAKENFIYAKKMLQNQQNNQNNQNNQDQDQNQDQNQNNDQNQDNQDKDDDKQDDQNKNDQDQQNQENQDRNQDQNNDRNRQNEQPKISPQAAQQMLQAIQAKEKETQEKVKEEKAKALKSRQKEKNW